MMGVAARVWAFWSGIWFSDRATHPIEITRIGLGSLLFITQLCLLPEMNAFYGNDGLITLQSLQAQSGDLPVFSLLFYVNEPWQFTVFQFVFIFCCGALALGWHTAWVKWLVWLGHLSLVMRNPFAVYGVDHFMASLLFILCLAPIGSNLSLDRVRAIRKLKKAQGLEATLPPATSEWGFACTRLIRIQMALLFFLAGISKLAGPEWWTGDAFWTAMNNYDTAFFPVGWLASQYWLGNLITWFAVLLEIAYPFLIWQHVSRVYILSEAILLHVGIAIMMGLHYFAAAMIFGHLIFTRRVWLTQLGEWLKAKLGSFEMIYDGQCRFCINSMAWLLSFDGLQQISVRDYRVNPSPLVENAKLDKALYVVTADGNTLPGFDAYRFVVARVPGLWWLIPFCYLPLVSRYFGAKIYNWIAENRNAISGCAVQNSDD